MSDIKELRDEQLSKVNGGNVLFNRNQCPCANFRPYDGNSGNANYANCSYINMLSQLGGQIDSCDENGVCKNFK